MKPLQSTTYNMTFKRSARHVIALAIRFDVADQLRHCRPSAAEIKSRMLSIAFKEKLKTNSAAIEQLVAGSNSDIRQVLNMMSSWKLTSSDMDFNQSKELCVLMVLHSMYKS